MNEFFQLLRNPAHWAFEIFVTVLVEGLILGLCWPFLRKHYLHHKARDQRDQIYNWAGTNIARPLPEVKSIQSEIAWTNATSYGAPPLFGCEKCEGDQVHLDTSVVICKECGHVVVPKNPNTSTTWS